MNYDDLFMFQSHPRSLKQVLELAVKPGLHIVRRIVGRDHVPKSILQLSGCRLQKSLVRNCYYQKHALPQGESTSASFVRGCVATGLEN